MKTVQERIVEIENKATLIRYEAHSLWSKFNEGEMDAQKLCVELDKLYRWHCNELKAMIGNLSWDVSKTEKEVKS